MTLDFEFHPEARAEFFADVGWYDDQEFGLGETFSSAIRGAVDETRQSPSTWPVWPHWDREPVVRSKKVGAFPYRIVYFVEQDILTIIAVAHAKRRPGYWRDRVEP